MSFILEAIRRSEEARHKRLIPDVSTMHTALPAPARAGSRTVQAALAMGVAMALVVTAGFALGPWLRQIRQPEAPAPVAAAAPVATVSKERDAAPAPQAAAADPALPGEPAPAAASPAPAAAPSPAPAPAGEPAEAKPPRRPYSSPATSGPEKARREPKPVAPSAGTRSEQGIGEAAREAAPPPPEATELVAATALRDLPPSVQRTLPNIAISLHRYAPSADARMIRVNGRVAHEGDAVGGELSVAEITRNGVVFTIGGQRFYMDAFQTWQAKSGS